MSWWVPLAIIGGAIFGAAVGYFLLASMGSPRGREAAPVGRLGFERTEKTNYTSWNPWAFLVVGAIVAVIVGLSVGLSFD